MTALRGLHPADRIARYQERGWWTDETADRLFLERVAEGGDRIAIIDPANRPALLGSEPRRVTWAELGDEVYGLAARLLDLGLGQGQVLAVQLPNTIELAEVYWAAWLIGVTVSPMPVQYREHEVLDMGNRAEFAVAIVASRFGDRTPLQEWTSIQDRIPSLRTIVTFGDPSEATDGIPHLVPAAATEEDRARVDAYRAEHPVDPNDCMTICWTSGTEGVPKGVPRAHYEWMAMSWATTEAPRLTKDDVVLNPFPMVNMAGINGVLLAWLRSGCTVVQHHPFDLGVFLQQIQDERVSYTCAPPALLMMLLHNEGLMAKYDLSSLTRLGSGSVPLQPAMVRGWQEKHGVGVINFFGSNEGIALLSSVEDFPDPDDRARYFPRYGAEGVHWSSRVSEWIQLKLVDLTTGEEITEPGRPGELRLGGPTVFPGYLGGTGDPFDEDGYLKTGDIFEIAGDRNQFLKYVDRAKDLVIRGGMNIAPVELEALIAEHPAVAEVAVVGDPDEVLGERVAAIVVLTPGHTLTFEELVQFLRDRKIASYKLPERLEILTALPRNPVGKILKRELRKLPAESGSR
ncbi:MAG: class I adenylate-forming enzyme family protein [Nocardioidaceae bacterium]